MSSSVTVAPLLVASVPVQILLTSRLLLPFFVTAMSTRLCRPSCFFDVHTGKPTIIGASRLGTSVICTFFSLVWAGNGFEVALGRIEAEIAVLKMCIS
jgi:hypothetical protein